MVTDRPATPRSRAPSAAAAARPGATSKAVNTQSRSRARKAALCITGEIECRIGCPMTAATRVLPATCQGGFMLGSDEALGTRLANELLELGVGRGEGVLSARVDEHVVEPRARRRVERGLERLLPDRCDRRRREARILARVVRRVGVEVGVRQLGLVRADRVLDGGVDAQLHVLL